MATADIELKDLKPVGLKDLKGLKNSKDLKVLACPEQGFSAVVSDREGEWWVWPWGKKVEARKADKEGEDEKDKNKKKKLDWWNTGTVGGIDLGLWVGWI